MPCVYIIFIHDLKLSYRGLKLCPIVEAHHIYSKTCVKWPLSKRPKMVSKTNYRLMQVKSIAECSFKLPFVIKTFVLSIFEWPIYTGFTVYTIVITQYAYKRGLLMFC